MISVAEALQIVLDNARDIGIEEIPLEAAMGRVLREEVSADRDFPPYDRITMDGIAIRYDRFEQGRRTFHMEGIVAAGAERQSLKNPDACLEVMTGAIMPEGADTVIRYEDILIDEGEATIQLDTLVLGQNVHDRGADRAKGQNLLEQGVRISASEIGVCATVGKHQIKVSRLPKALILSTGNELVEINEIPRDHQIRKSNVHCAASLLRSYKVPVDIAHLMDDYDEIIVKMKEYLDIYDVILLSGGISKGKFDFLPDALKELGVRQLFHKVKQRPGKPFWFGQYGKDTTVFAFPGNPVSGFMCLFHYFLPWLESSTGLVANKELPVAVLAEDVQFKPDLTYFLQVQLRF